MHRFTFPLLALSLLALGCAIDATARPSHQQESRMTAQSVPGYRLHDRTLPRAPISLDELGLIWKSALFTDEDVRYLRMSKGVLEPHVKELVGVWYGFVGANPHLLASFSSDAGEVDGAYLEAVRARFERWVLDTADAEYDQDWLDYQFEIGRRHHRVGKNATDGANATSHIPFRYLSALAIPVTTTLKPFLEKGGHSDEDVEKMHAAWVKSVQVQAILWSYPYMHEGDF